MTNNKFVDIKDFTKLQKISDGGFGNVFVAIKNDQPDIKLVAKISKKSFDDKVEDFELYVKREVNALFQLRHPYIIKFIGYSPLNFDNEPYPVIFTEYLPNGSLDKIIELERLNKSPKAWNDTKKLINIFGIASIMKYLHSENLIHRDLKPGNILEDEFLFPKIADFGLSKVIHRQESTSIESKKEMKGTIQYMAPEIINNDEYSKSSDVYAFAIIVYEIITNEIPYNTQNFANIMKKAISNIRPHIDKSVPQCYRDLITKCWSENPCARPTFDKIVDDLKKNKKFITKNVNEKEFHDYIEIVENKGKPIDPTDKFTKVTISRSLSRPDSNQEINPVINNDKIEDYEQFRRLPEVIKDILKKILKNQIANTKIAKFSGNDLLILANNRSFDSEDFITMLHYFSKVIFELEDTNIAFKKLFSQISELANSNAKNIEIHIPYTNNPKIKQLLENQKVPILIDIQNSVQTIQSEAFKNCTSIFEVIIPPSVKEINKKAFQKCRTLKKIVIPSSVEIIEENAFAKCTLLEKIEILSQLKIIKNFTFVKCQSLNQIVIPESVEVIEQFSFHDCCSLEEIIIPSSVKRIENSAFAGCSSLEKISLPESITVIENCLFDECSSLIEITIPSSITTIEFSAFNACTSLNKVNFKSNSSLSIIKYGAFSLCTSLEEINLPNSIKSIEPYCFTGCIKLKKITISSLKKVSENLFEGCVSLERIIIPYPATIIDKKAFRSCSKLTHVAIPQSVTSINYQSFSLCYSLTDLIIPSSVIKIKSYAFDNCISLTHLAIPSSVEKIGEYAFRGCNKLINIDFNPSITKIDKSIFEKCSLLESITIPSSVVKIKKCAFQGCSSMKTVTFCSPSHLSKIGDFAFCLCTSLTNISIPSKVKLGKEVFRGCQSLKNIKY